MRDANGTERLAADVERRPARSPADTAWARERVRVAQAIWTHAGARYGWPWARGLRILFSGADPVPAMAHADDDAAPLEELRRWVAAQGAARG